MKTLWIPHGLFSALLVLVDTLSAPAAESPLYAQDFERITPGKMPEDFLVLDGAFAVREENGNQFLELPGAPLETFGVLFGPSAKEDRSVSARIHAINRGRRYPAFGIGLNGLGGFRLQVSPAKRRLELFRAEEAITSIDHLWEPDTWTWFRLQIQRAGDQGWRVQGKIWSEDNPEPKDWMITHTTQKEPYPGKASVWGKPFSGLPIRFDDFTVHTASEEE